jgi:CheY-like chemotaxis protein
MELRRVLVVEGHAGAREILVAALAAEGYDVRGASDGREALAHLATWRPRIIVLDATGEPGEDPARARLVARAELRRIPLLVRSAPAGQRSGATALNAIDLALLLELVSRLSGPAPPER